ncbi:MAG: HEAT repeat domain-containing protein [Candidatus Omnitrophica bacterium]|nr:HEAT repeat domain-containing protein [Candidatus Omnitrophota bacterium]
MKFPFWDGQDDAFIAPSGNTDRLSQSLFGKYGEEKCWEAIDSLSASKQSAWSKRLFLWMLSSENPEIKERVWEILDYAEFDLELLIHELSSPLWAARAAAIRLIAKSGRLDVVRLLICGLEDYHPKVVDETLLSLATLIKNAQARKERGELEPDEIHDAFTILFQLLYYSKRSPRFQAIPFLFQAAPLNEDLFWEKYLELDLPQFTILHEEFLRCQKNGSLNVLYRGLLQRDESIQERIANFLSAAIRSSGSSVNHHLAALRDLSREDFSRIAIILQNHRLLVEFQGLIKHIAPPERIILFDLLESVGAEQNLSFLLRCLQLDDSRIRIRVLKILGDSPNLGLRNEAFEFLTDSDEQVLLATLRYLQKKGDLSILERISPLTRSPKKKVKQGVVGAMFKIMKDNLLRKFDRLSVSKRKKILSSLTKMKPEFFEEIAYLCESPDESERIKYIKMLESEALNKAIKSYRKLSRDPNPNVRATAIRGFGRVDDMAVRYMMLRRFFDDPDPRVRSNAIDLLPEEKPDDPSMLAIAKRAAKSASWRERANAIAKLINWGFAKYETELVSMLDSEDEAVKTSALWILGVTHLPHLTYRLREAANDPHAPVRKMAVRGIGLCGDHEDVRALMPFLQDPDRGVRAAARDALRARLNLSFEIA